MKVWDFISNDCIVYNRHYDSCESVVGCDEQELRLHFMCKTVYPGCDDGGKTIDSINSWIWAFVICDISSDCSKL